MVFLFAFNLGTAAQTLKPLKSGHFQISGTVVNAITNQPLARVQVALNIAEQQDHVRRVHTDDQGRFTFANLSAGKYSLYARKRGFPLQGYQQHDEYWTGIAVGPNLQSDGIIFPLSPGATISGAIINNQGDSLGGATVLLFRRGVINGKRRIRMVQQTVTDDQDHYVFSHLLPGSYFVAVNALPWFVNERNETLLRNHIDSMAPTYLAPEKHSAMDYAYPVTFYPGVTESASATAISLKPGDHISADVVITASPATHVSLQNSTGDSDAMYRVEFLQQIFGSYSLNINTAGVMQANPQMVVLPTGQYVIHTQSFGSASDANSRGGSQVVDISGDMEIDPSKISSAKISGTAALDGKPVVTGTVQLRNVDTDEVVEAEVLRGSFHIDGGVNPGTYELLVHGPDNDIGVGHFSASGAVVMGTSVRITGAQDIDFKVTVVNAVARVDGIALKDSKPASQTMVLLIPEDFEHNVSSLRRDQSDSDGTFALRFALPGNYRVVAIQKGWDLEWENPDVFKPYFEHGVPLQIIANQKYKVQVPVQ
jgi:5-hydroxyisourate hydrolase-like protein (transthyretin family)